MLGPQISIIVPFYNRIELLKKTIQSVQEQKFKNWELLLVDDGSEEGIADYFNELKDQRIKLFNRIRPPKGAPACRNIGFKEAKSDWILFLDSDDLLAPWACEERLEFIHKNPGFSLYVFEGLEFDNSNPNYQRLRTIQTCQDPLKGFLSFKSVWQTSCVVWERSALIEINGWNEKAESWQDGEVHVRALLSGLKHKWSFSLPDVFIRKHTDNLRISSGLSVKKIENLIKVYRGLETFLSEHGALLKRFQKNWKNLIFTYAELLPKQLLSDYFLLIKKDFSPSWFKSTLLIYISLLKVVSPNWFLRRSIFQLRKIGIPNFRKDFWGERPQLPPEKKKEFGLRLDIGQFLLNEVAWLKNFHNI